LYLLLGGRMIKKILLLLFIPFMLSANGLNDRIPDICDRLREEGVNLIEDISNTLIFADLSLCNKNYELAKSRYKELTFKYTRFLLDIGAYEILEKAWGGLIISQFLLTNDLDSFRDEIKILFSHDENKYFELEKCWNFNSD